MEEEVALTKLLVQHTSDFGKISFAFFKLKVIDNSEEVVSTMAPRAGVLSLVAACLLFLGSGAAMVVDKGLGKPHDGFFVVAALYALPGLLICVLMYLVKFVFLLDFGKQNPKESIS